MPLRYDAAVKTLIEKYPSDWLRSLGVAVEGPVRVIDADLSAVSADADRVLYRERPERSLINLELQTSRNPKLLVRMLKYAVLLFERHELPVHSIIVLLRPEADFAGLTGHVGYETGDGTRLSFDFPVVRLWEQSPDWALEGGLGTLPLAPLTQVTQTELPVVIRQMEDRLSTVEPPIRDDLWTATYILWGCAIQGRSAARYCGRCVR